MFSVYFTKSQAEQFIKESLQKNFINVPEFIVRISDEVSDMEIKKYIKELSSGSELKADAKDKAEVNPWLVPDENGWFTHDPEWNLKVAPKYVDGTKEVFVVLKDGDVSETPAASSYYDWRQQNSPWDVAKWKYAE